jgi:alpha-beta hydrolase superfamily lysophospholipase
MGGLIAARVMLDAQDDYSGLILTGPALGVPSPPPWWQVALLRVLSALMPASKALAIDAKAVSRDPSVVDAYTADPLVHHDNIPARMVVSLFDEGQFVLDNAGHITLPVLLLHGEEDQLTSVPASRQFIEALGASDKHLTIYPGMYHELFNEPERAEIIDTCIAWIRQRLV